MKPAVKDEQSSAKEEPKKARKAVTPFTREEDLLIINYYKEQKAMPDLKKLLPDRGDTSVRARTAHLFKRWEERAGEK